MTQTPPRSKFTIDSGLKYALISEDVLSNLRRQAERSAARGIYSKLDLLSGIKFGNSKVKWQGDYLHGT